MAIAVCYDLEFPEWMRTLALAGADVLAAPVNWPLFPRPEGERPLEIVRAQANASVNHIFVAACDRAGVERGQEWLGGSVIIDPDGFPLTTITLGRPHIALARIDVTTARDKAIGPRNDVFGDRRPALYRAVVGE